MRTAHRTRGVATAHVREGARFELETCQSRDRDVPEWCKCWGWSVAVRLTYPGSGRNNRRPARTVTA
jgi:hypothetical protein